MSKRLIAVFISFLILLSFVSPLSVSAHPINQASENEPLLEELEEYEIEELKEKFEKMSIDELQSILNSIGQNIYGKSIKSPAMAYMEPTVVTTGILPNAPLKGAWLAAAAIARKMGYPAAATLVEYSVNGKGIYLEAEDSGGSLFRDKIIKTTAYKDFINSGYSKQDIVFERSDNADLFYAIHKCTIYLTTVNGRNAIYVTDDFNFEPWSYEGNLFASIINNTGLFFQMCLVLREVKVYITFYR